MILGWLGNALILSGAWCIGYKWRAGFLIATAGGACWLVEGFRLVRPDLIFIELIMGLIAVRNYLKWGKNDG